MSRITKSRLCLALAMCAALVASAISASAASASINPFGDSINIGSTNSEFTVEEGGVAVTVKCEVAATSGTIPAAAAVEMTIEPPGFTNVEGTTCAASNGEQAKIVTKPTWKLIEESTTAGAIEVPMEGAVISIGTLCKVKIGGTSAVKVKGKWFNGTDSKTHPSTIKFTGAEVSKVTLTNCGISPLMAKFSGLFIVNDATKQPAAVKFT